MISIPALVLTFACVLLVGAILVAFGRAAGGAWSIAGGVVRGVREWSGQRGASDTAMTSSPSAPSSPLSPSSPLLAATPASPSAPAADLEDFGDRPTG